MKKKKIIVFAIDMNHSICHSRESGNPEYINPGFRIKCGMTKRNGSPIRSGMTEKGAQG